MESKRTLIITGSLRGLGLGISQRFIRHGDFRVILTSRQPCETTIVQLKKVNPSAVVDYHQLEVDSTVSCDKFVAWIKERYGQFDVLINNAGINEITSKYTNKYEIEQDVLNINFFSLINLTNKLLPYLTFDGKVINITSDAAKLGLQGESIQKELSDADITEEQLIQKANELLEMRRNGTLEGWKEHQRPRVPGTTSTMYKASKALCNAYTRFALPKKLGGQRLAISLHPGKYSQCVQTQMAGTAGRLTIEEGSLSTYKAVVDIPFGDKKYQGIFLDEYGSEWDPI